MARLGVLAGRMTAPWIHPGIPMRDMMAAVSAGFLASTPLLDMNHHEASARHCPEVALAMHTGLSKVVIMQVSLWLPLS